MMKAKKTYKRIKFTDNDRIKIVILSVTSETDLFVSGIEVNKYSDEIVPRGRYTERLRIIDKSIILDIQPMTMNLKYSELEINKMGR